MSAPAPRVAVVTGAGRGIGAATARLLAHRGLAVGLVARSSEELERTADAIRAGGGTCVAVPADVADPGQTRAAHGTVVAELGPVDVLVNNAATVLPVRPLVTADLDTWWTAFEVNVRGAAYWLRLTLPGMRQRGWGRVVGVSSLLAALPLPGASAYCASKAAFESLHLAVAQEVTEPDVLVNTFWPGTVDTVMQAQIRHEPLSTVGGRPRPQARDPLDVAHALISLCGDDCTLRGTRVDLDTPVSDAGASAGTAATR